MSDVSHAHESDSHTNHLSPRNFTWAELREHLTTTHHIDPTWLDDGWNNDVRRRRHAADVRHEECHEGLT